MKRVQRHLPIPMLLLALTIIVTVFSSVYPSREAGSYQLVDFYGERAVLDDVRIHGQMRDSYHETAFVWASGQSTVDTTIYSKPRDIQISGIDWWYQARIGNNFFEIRDYASEHIINHRDIESPESRNLGSVRVVARISQVPTDRNYHGNPRRYGLTQIDERFYYTITLGNSYTGESGIYRLNFSAGETVPAEVLVPLSLEPNASLRGSVDQYSGLSVLGLEAVGDKLALITVLDHELMVRSYDSITGELLGEASVPDFHQRENYQAYINEASQILIIGFYNYSADGKTMTYVNLDFSDDVRLIDVIEGASTNFEEARNDGVTRMYYQDGRLYIVSVVQELEGRMGGMYITDPRRLLITVYEGQALVYQGELTTDLNDDRIWTFNQNPDQIVGYERREHRSINALEIHSANE